MNRVLYSINNGIRTAPDFRKRVANFAKSAVVIGVTFFLETAYVEAQVQKDPYPPFGSAAVSQSFTPIPPSQDGILLQGPQLSSFPGPATKPVSALDARSERLERIAQDADRHTQRAFELASRGARYSAQAELVRALRLVSQGLDSERQCRVYSESLGVGLKALEEVEDFIPTGSQLESDLPLREIVARHQTTILKQENLKQGEVPMLPTPIEAVGLYLRYAQEQLAMAVGGEVAGSMALHGLGKLYATEKGTELNIATSQAIVCFRAAATVCPQNYLAHNDLGVLLAQNGRLEDARAVFEKSVTLRPHPTTMANLVKVYQTLGQKQQAAEMQARLAGFQSSKSTASKIVPIVDWVSPEQFSETYAKTPDARQLPPVQRSGETPAKPSVEQADRSWPWNWRK